MFSGRSLQASRWRHLICKCRLHNICFPGCVSISPFLSFFCFTTSPFHLNLLLEFVSFILPFSGAHDVQLNYCVGANAAMAFDRAVNKFCDVVFKSPLQKKRGLPAVLCHCCLYRRLPASITEIYTQIILSYLQRADSKCQADSASASNVFVADGGFDSFTSLSKEWDTVLDELSSLALSGYIMNKVSSRLVQPPVPYV